MHYSPTPLTKSCFLKGRAKVRNAFPYSGSLYGTQRIVHTCFGNSLLVLLQEDFVKHSQVIMSFGVLFNTPPNFRAMWMWPINDISFHSFTQHAGDDHWDLCHESWSCCRGSSRGSSKVITSRWSYRPVLTGRGVCHKDIHSHLMLEIYIKKNTTKNPPPWKNNNSLLTQ